MIQIYKNIDFKKHGLFAIVFITGAAVLVIEILAIRILSIHFGNTVYTDSAVIAVILAALSVGYARGGVLADANPTQLAFFNSIEKAGLSFVVFFFLLVVVVPTASAFLPLSWGPLVVALVLFFIPSYFLGMLSPFAIKLGDIGHATSKTGTISGKVFFWSTVGSLVGTLLTSFVFIPYFGLNTIIFATSACVLILGSLGKAHASRGFARHQTVVVLILALLALGVIWWTSVKFQPNALVNRDGVYQHLSIFDGTVAGRPARFFYQDRSEDNFMYLDDPTELASLYTKYYALYKIFIPKLSSALFIGGGMYSMPAALNRDMPDARIDVVETEPSLFLLAKKYFFLPDDPHIVNHVEDGRRFLNGSSASYDMIWSDVYYSLYSVPPAYTTKEFFSEARSKLSPKGIFVANFIGTLSADQPSLILSEIRTMQSVFPKVYVFATKSPNIPDVQNIVVLGLNDAGSFNLTGLIPVPLPPNILAHIVPVERYDLSQYLILTDNYAPVEFMTSKILKISQSQDSTILDDSLWSGTRAMKDIAAQLSFGVRALGAQGHQKEIEYIKDQLSSTAAAVSEQKTAYKASDGTPSPITNIIARFDPTNPRRIVVGTHYDSIVRAYADKENPQAEMPGANNSASGVALLLETARALNKLPHPAVGVDFVFFDGEEGPQSLGAGDPNWYPLGSPLFVDNIKGFYPLSAKNVPEEAVLFDMVCDKDLTIKPELSSSMIAKSQVESFWNIGRTVAPLAFSRTPTSAAIRDDQSAFLHAGIPSFLVIDFEYDPWFNTTDDTLDKCSPQSMESVGKTLLQYIYSR